LWKHRMDIWPGIAKHKHRLLSEHYQHMICVFCEIWRIFTASKRGSTNHCMNQFNGQLFL